ncbi:MAG: glucokinase [Candidatus Heimdallarchaeota archaeon]|nr:glucokinase [Candidatus Heimdallarchaeota archaeon]MDH5646517.1 glucokinase [Candidatus Heimdallarchaeota archaeon]
MYFIGDIGASKTHIIILSSEYNIIYSNKFINSSVVDFYDIIHSSLVDIQIPLKYALIGIAAPVMSDIIQLTNINWIIDKNKIMELLKCKVDLFNDVYLLTIAIQNLNTKYFYPIQQTIMTSKGIRCTIAIGTGIGVTIEDTELFTIYATESGHTEFLPQFELGLKFSQFIKQNSNYVSIESLCSSIGLKNLIIFFKLNKSFLSEKQIHLINQVDENINFEKLAEYTELYLFIREILIQIIAGFIRNKILELLPKAGIVITGGFGYNLFADHISKQLLRKYLIKNDWTDIIVEETPIFIVNPNDIPTGWIKYVKNLFN